MQRLEVSGAVRPPIGVVRCQRVKSNLRYKKYSSQFRKYVPFIAPWRHVCEEAEE